jgi:hypothetical protein
MMKRMRLGLLAIGLLVAPPAAEAQATYTVNFNGGTIDLAGTIQVSAFGLWSPQNFDANAVNYSITASSNGTSIFTFTNENSKWGGNVNGLLTTINATAGLLQLSGGGYDAGSALGIFLIATATTDGRVENLRLFSGGNIGYFPPIASGLGLISEQVGDPFTLGTSSVVPEPGTYALMAVGLLGLAAVRRRRT